MSSSKKNSVRTHISTYFNEKEFLKKWNDAKYNLEKTEKTLNKIVEESTKPELDAVEKALEAYNTKIKKITSSDEFLKVKKELDTYQKQLSGHMQRAFQVFEDERQKIMNSSQSEEEKKKSIIHLQDYIISKLYTPEEIETFKRHVTVFSFSFPRIS